MSRHDMFKGISPKELRALKATVFNERGSEALTYLLGSLDDFLNTRLVSAIHSAVRIGVAVVLSIILFLTSRGYRSPLFIIYQVNFGFMLIGSALELGWQFSFSASMTEYLTSGDNPRSSLNLSVAASVFLTLLIMSLLASLVLQVYFSCTDLHRRYQLGITLLAAIGCIPAYLIWIWRLVLVFIQNLGPSGGGGQGAYGWGNDNWVFYGAWGSFAASTSFCSLILCVKLWKVQRDRSKLGMENFNPIKVLLTMALQNSALPAVLALVSSGLNPNNFGAQSVAASAVPLTAALLPVGYIWAQVTGDTPNKRQGNPTMRVEDAERMMHMAHDRRREQALAFVEPTTEATGKTTLFENEHNEK